MALSPLDTSLITISDILWTVVISHTLLAIYHAVIVVFCMLLGYLSFFGYNWLRAMVIAEAAATVMAIVGHDSRNT